MSDIGKADIEGMAALIAEQYAPMHDPRAPFAKVAAEKAARAAWSYALMRLAEPSEGMFMQGGNVPISNVGPGGQWRRGRIGDMAARDAFTVMIAAKRRELGLEEG